MFQLVYAFYSNKLLSQYSLSRNSASPIEDCAKCSAAGDLNFQKVPTASGLTEMIYQISHVKFYRDLQDKYRSATSFIQHRKYRTRSSPIFKLSAFSVTMSIFIRINQKSFRSLKLPPVRKQNRNIQSEYTFYTASILGLIFFRNSSF